MRIEAKMIQSGLGIDIKNETIMTVYLMFPATNATFNPLVTILAQKRYRRALIVSFLSFYDVTKEKIQTGPIRIIRRSITSRSSTQSAMELKVYCFWVLGGLAPNQGISGHVLY